MPTLPNARQERFAQALFDGKSAIEAYGMAGYKPDRGSASKLQRVTSIAQRVAELHAERVRLQTESTADAIKAAGLTKRWTIEQLMVVVYRCLQAEPVLDNQGEPTGEWKFDGRGATKALELLAKMQTMFGLSDEKPDLGALLALMGNGKGTGNGHAERPRVYDA